MAEPQNQAHDGTIVKTELGLSQPVITLADGTRKRLKAFPEGTREGNGARKDRGVQR